VPRVVFRLPGGRERAVAAVEGASVLQAARAGAVAIEGSCGGAMACATCHVVVDGAWHGRLPPPSAEEEGMLDLAREPTPTSRLGCQIRLTPALDGLVVRVPASSLLE
jgi:2Fe-2S ferredoxin